MDTRTVVETLNEHGVQYVVIGPLAVLLANPARRRLAALDLCFRQEWSNCESLDRALDQLGAELVPSPAVPIPLTGELRKAFEPIRVRTAAGMLTLTPTVPGLGCYDDLVLEAGWVDFDGVGAPVLSAAQLRRWAGSSPRGAAP